MRLWDAGSGASAGELEHDGRVRAVAAVQAAASPILIVSYAGDRLWIWDAGTGALRHAFDPGRTRLLGCHGAFVEQVLFGPDDTSSRPTRRHCPTDSW
jgi:hypothetical protein